MSDTAARRLSQALFALTIVLFCTVVTVAVIYTARGVTTWRDTLPDLGFAAALLSFSIVGVVIARQQPRNAIAWVLLGVGFTWQLSGVSDVWAQWGFAYPGSLPGAAYAAVFSAAAWIPGLAPLGTFLILLFPDGHLPSRRWRWWALLSGVVPAMAMLGILVAPGPIDDQRWTAANPLGIEALRGFEFVVYTWIVLIPVCIVGCAVALVRRFRRASGVERMQLKWLTTAGAVVAALYLVTMFVSIPFDWAEGANVPWPVSLLQNASLLAFMLIPVAVGTAILRYRLYDIDRLINRALVYFTATALLVAVYAGGVVGAQSLLRGITGSAQNNLAVAASTLAVAALFRPALQRIQSFVDRRFYRRKYDAARTVEAFSVGLRQETDLQRLSDDLRDIVAQTVQPAGVTLWIAGGHRKNA